MPNPVKLAIVGLGRIGVVHARHAQQLAASGVCELAALVDSDRVRAQALAAEFASQGTRVQPFGSIDELIAAGATTAAVIATPTDQHGPHAERLIAAGHRILLEKSMTASLDSDRAFVRKLNDTAPDALMLAFQRRFDPPLVRAKQLLGDGLIGRPFKLVSVLEDSAPVPPGYQSAGLLQDMSVHNVDEAMWLTGRTPTAALAIGSRLYSHRHSPVNEDFDDGFLQLWFGSDMTAQIQVSRNHVPGYRVETWIFGEEGNIHVGHFEQKGEVVVEAYSRDKRLTWEVFPLPDCGGPDDGRPDRGSDLPEFVGRFGDAYRDELAYFVEQCRNGEPFAVNQNDGLRAMEVIDAALQSLMTRAKASTLASQGY